MGSVPPKSQKYIYFLKGHVVYLVCLLAFLIPPTCSVWLQLTTGLIFKKGDLGLLGAWNSNPHVWLSTALQLILPQICKSVLFTQPLRQFCLQALISVQALQPHFCPQLPSATSIQTISHYPAPSSQFRSYAPHVFSNCSVPSSLSVMPYHFFSVPIKTPSVLLQTLHIFPALHWPPLLPSPQSLPHLLSQCFSWGSSGLVRVQ